MQIKVLKHMKKQIKMKQPKPYQDVAINFVISGWVHKSWLDKGSSINDRLSLDFIDINGQTFFCTSINILPTTGWFLKFKNRLKFYGVFQISHYSSSFIIESQGRITLRLSGEKKEQQLFVPVIIKSSNPHFVPDIQIVERHSNVGQIVLQYEKEWIEYTQKFNEIWERRQKKSGIDEYPTETYNYVEDKNLFCGLMGILEGSNNSLHQKNLLAKEDLEIQELNEKYKETIKINGPLLGGNVLTYGGFHCIIHTNDHGKHLHVIHKGIGLDVRISFPKIEIESYKSGTLNSKQRKKIIKFLKYPENFKKLEEEFLRRDTKN
jgi:hypothetical protein